MMKRGAKQPCLVIVDTANQPLGMLLASELQERGATVQVVSPLTLGQLRVALTGDTFCVNDTPVAGIFSLTLPHGFFSGAFVEEDRSFCNVEIGAVWLAACHLESVLAINRYDAAGWFDRLSWPLWHRTLSKAGVTASPFSVGDVCTDNAHQWYPYGSGVPHPAPAQSARRVLGSAITRSQQKQVSLVVCEEVICGAVTPELIRTAKLLAKSGVRIAAITTDVSGCILAVNVRPVIFADDLLRRAADLLVREYDAHLRHW
jgi:hypothetical protein